MSEPVVMSWGGGKESLLALRWALEQPSLSVRALMTTVTEGDVERISGHGVRRGLLEAQAASLGLPLEIVRVPQQATDREREAAMAPWLREQRRAGVRRVVFGNVLLEHARRARERQVAAVDMEGLFPLWGRDTRKLSHEVIDLGVLAILVCVDPNQLEPFFVGRDFDWPMLADLPAQLDPCGERGEFHTFVYGGPVFRRPVDVSRGEIGERDGLWFCDLLPTATSAPRP